MEKYYDMPLGRYCKQLCYSLGVVALLSLTSFQDPDTLGGSKLQVKVEGLRSEKGVVRIALFNKEEGFPGGNQHAFKVLTHSAKGGVVQAVFHDLPAGRYAIAVLHDENENGKLDTNLVGYPKEGYGASNNVIPMFRAPNFQEAAFEVRKAEERLTILIRN